jgi:hypothetical protein
MDTNPPQVQLSWTLSSLLMALNPSIHVTLTPDDALYSARSQALQTSSIRLVAASQLLDGCRGYAFQPSHACNGRYLGLPVFRSSFSGRAAYKPTSIYSVTARLILPTENRLDRAN